VGVGFQNALTERLVRPGRKDGEAAVFDQPLQLVTLEMADEADVIKALGPHSLLEFASLRPVPGDG
jgi:hypothetical protein